MKRMLKNSFLGTAVLILFFLTAIHPCMAEDIPLPPMTVSGVAFIDGTPAPVDTIIAAYLDGEFVEQFLVNTPSGSFTFYISGAAGDEGKPVTFTIDGKDTGKSFDWKSGTLVSSIELSTGDSADSGSSNESSNLSSGSLTGSEDPEKDEEIIENDTVPQPEVTVSEKVEQESADDRADIEKGEESPKNASETGSAPGFQIIYAVAGIILLTFGSELWRESRRKP